MNKPARLCPLLVAAAALLASPAFAQEDPAVVVSVQQLNQVPMAVPDAKPGDGTDAAIGVDIAAILRKDFRISGAFEVLDPTTFLPGLSDEGVAATVDYKNWYSSGAEALVKCGYKTQSGALVLDCRLFDVLGSKEVRLSWTDPGATPSSYRASVHAFANAVIRYYTGFDGIFGQELLVVRKDRKRGESNVYRIGTDGEGLSRVSQGGDVNILPSWGPGGSVLYTSYASGNPDVVKTSGGSTTTLSSSSGLNSGADYCAGSGLIALTLSKDENPEIYVMSGDGGGLTRLTNNSYIDTSPTWSPDCSQIAFVSNRGGSPQIYVMGADGSGARAVTTAGRYNTSPSWAPSGGKIAFTGRDEYNVFDIFVVDAESGYIERLTQDQGHNEEPTWSPDGRYLAFTSTRDGGSKLFIMTADGRFQTPITEAGGYETPAWSL